MAHSHCTGPGQGAGCSVHIAMRLGVGQGARNIMCACLHVLETAPFQPRVFVFVVLHD